MRKSSLAILIFSIFIIAGCAFAPFNAPRTARSNNIGESNTNVGILVPGIEYSRGVVANTDIGVAAELQFAPVLSFWLKHSLINNPEGGSMGIYGGGFYSAGLYDSTSSGYFLGPIFSYRENRAEWYLSTKYNYVNWNIPENSNRTLHNGPFFNPGPMNIILKYAQLNAGLSYWRSDNVSLDLSALCVITEPKKEKIACAPMLGFGWSTKK